MKELIPVEKRFAEIFINKGNIGPIAEKSKKNLSLIKEDSILQKERTYYFAVGHTFKNIDKSIFEYKLDEQRESLVPSRFIYLQKDFDCTKLVNVVNNIRNVNNHYIHTFDKLEISKIDQATILFIKDAFELAVLMTYLKEEETTYSELTATSDIDTELTIYLCNKFFPNSTYQKDIRDRFLTLSLSEAIDYLLFINVEKEFEWKIQDSYSIFNILPGKYPSSHAHLFILSLFLYKGEANQLISKIKGFKRTEDEFHFKRDIFTFFSKKYSSQNIDSEEKYLIRFRDIIQYLNHFPTTWNSALEPERLHPKMIGDLEKYIIETEIFRSFPECLNHPDQNSFLLYAVNKLFPHKRELFGISVDSHLKTERNSRFDYIINASPELKDIDLKIKELANTNHPSLKYKLEKQKKKCLKKVNPVTEKLVRRIKEEKLLKSYGRNQDRFMEIAARFLAEENYFGADAEFKLYEFYTTDQQNKELEYLSKKELDKKKYHHGKSTYYSTFQKHHEKYPYWDTPFIIENNAIKVKIRIENGDQKLFSIQRNLMIYLLEDALYTNPNNTITNQGKYLLINYYSNYLLPDFISAKEVILNTDDISSEQKNELKRLLPKRLLYNYHPAVKYEEKEQNPFSKIIEDAEKQEKRYSLLLQKAKDLQLEEEFLAKNKGKQFKLRFLRKVWHIMFFRDIYLEQAKKHGHHKSFHITKIEFDSFSKWMYSFDEVPQYKNYLARMFTTKKFLTNSIFNDLFQAGNSLDELYQNTKYLFSDWIQSKSTEEFLKRKYTLNGYDLILKKDIIYINTSHFISFLEKEEKIQRNKRHIIQYKALQNIPYLVEAYYYKNVLPKDEYKSNGKLFNKLRTNKLEDALLYELAVRYLYMNKTIQQRVKSKVSAILNTSITFDIRNDSGEHLYDLIVPFNKLESLAVLIKNKSSEEQSKKMDGSFLGNIPKYLKSSVNSKDIKQIYQVFKQTKQLNYEDLNKLDNHIIASSIKFSKVIIALEAYFILKNKTRIKPVGYIKTSEIIGLDNLVDKDDRNKASHFNIPPMGGYEQVIKKIEDAFVKQEIYPYSPSSFAALTPEQKNICRLFMDVLHNNLFKKSRLVKNESEDEKKERIKKEKTDFETVYFNKVILS